MKKHVVVNPFGGYDGQHSHKKPIGLTRNEITVFVNKLVFRPGQKVYEQACEYLGMIREFSRKTARNLSPGRFDMTPRNNLGNITDEEIVTSEAFLEGITHSLAIR